MMGKSSLHALLGCLDKVEATKVSAGKMAAPHYAETPCGPFPFTVHAPAKTETAATAHTA